jgi:hypothetical protein
MNTLRTTVVRTSARATHRVQKRQMAAGAAPQWTGIDKVIRDKFPEDYQGEQTSVRWSCGDKNLRCKYFSSVPKQCI